MKTLAICGSLRAASINAALLRAAARLSPPEMQVRQLSRLGELPLFSPDLEHDLPVQIAAYHAEIASADALLIASPEYAHGVTGAIKNALDWLVSFEPFINKPVAVLNASPRAHHADDALRETLRTMSAVVVEQASIPIPLLGAHLTEDGMVEHPTISHAIRGALEALYSFVVPRRHEQGPTFPIA
jgi:chromate reductase, NAD(P)H dehydrogenase (quinone)